MFSMTYIKGDRIGLDYNRCTPESVMRSRFVFSCHLFRNLSTLYLWCYNKNV